MSKSKFQKQIDALKPSIFSRYLGSSSIAKLAEGFSFESYGPGKVIIEQGADPIGLFVVVEGEVAVEVFSYANPDYKERKLGDGDDDGEKKEFKVIPHRKFGDKKLIAVKGKCQKSVLSTRKPGDCFGQRCLLNEIPNYQAVSVGKTVCLRYKKDAYQKWIKTIGANLEKKINHCMGFGMEHALQRIPFLKNIPVDKLQLLSSVFRFKVVEKDHHLYKKGELPDAKGNSLFYLAHGEMKVSADEKEEWTLGRGYWLGEFGAVVHVPHLATCLATKKSLFFELTQTDFRGFCKLAAELLEVFQDVYEDYNVHHRYMIQDMAIVKHLTRFMETEQSAENIKFLMRLKAFEESSDNDNIKDQAQELFDEFVSEQANTQINILGKIRKDVNLVLKSGNIPRNVFQKPKDEVLALMGRDTLPRFKGGDAFRKCLYDVMQTAIPVS